MANYQNLNQELEDEIEILYNSTNDNDNYGSDDAEFIDELLPVVNAGIKAVNNIVGGGIQTAANTASRVARGVGTILGVNPTPASTAGIAGSSNLSGTINTSTGKQLPFRLPANIATKADVDIIRGAISKVNNEIKAVADANNVNAQALKKLTKEVDDIDKKHSTATKTQNTYIGKIGKAVDKLGKELKDTKQQAQMQMMMSMMMPNQIDKLTFESAPEAKVAVPVLNTEMKDDNSMLMMMMAMGGMGGSSDAGNNDMMNNPLMMMLMIKAME
ncbi:MAG: hypothetical protein IPJ79_05565 [Bacteroidetes bacterium]|nr:hypothetical protein [Bacteroidota bacterium]